MGVDNVMHQGSLLTSSLIMKTTEIESAIEGYKFGQGVGYLSPVCPIIHMLKWTRWFLYSYVVLA